jgi:hypothetical protein
MLDKFKGYIVGAILALYGALMTYIAILQRKNQRLEKEAEKAKVGEELAQLELGLAGSRKEAKDAEAEYRRLRAEFHTFGNSGKPEDGES